ncbi:Huntingtin-interacting protein K [Chlorella vulgaris]
MADEVEVEKPKGREAGETAAALDKVTDFSEEKEMRANVDNSKVQQAMQALAAEQAQRNEAQRQRERELAAVKVQKQDVELIAQQFDLDKKKAERCLREVKGDVKAALTQLLQRMHHADAAARPGEHVLGPPPLPPLLESLLDEKWWGGSSYGSAVTPDARAAGTEQQPVPGSAPGQQSGGLAAALFQLPAWLRLGGKQAAPPPAAVARRSSRRQRKPVVSGRPASAEAAAHRRVSSSSEGTAEAASRGAEAPGSQTVHTQAAASHGPRLPRRPSLAMLQQLAGVLPRSQGEAAHGAKPRPGSKAANYAERRLAWRQRIDAIKAKQATRAAAGGSVEVLTAVGTGSSRVFSKHVAIPIPAATSQRAGSTGSTPQGSPARREAVLEAQLASLPKLETPPIWQGFQTAEAPPDMAAAGEEQLQRFLLQAGWTPEAVWGLAGHEALVEAARASRGAWEVDRVIVACVWPEEVLRVPRRCSDTTLLRTAYKRVSMAVHPDKCHAVGASDAQSIVSDCYAMLLHASSGGKAIAAVPAFLRQQHAMRATVVSSSGQTAGAGHVGVGSRASSGAAEHSVPAQMPQHQHQHMEHDLSAVDLQAASQAARPAWQAFHAAAEGDDSTPFGAASLSTWIPVPLDPPPHAHQQEVEGQHEQQQQDELCSSSVELEAAACREDDRAQEAWMHQGLCGYEEEQQQQQQQQQQQGACAARLAAAALPGATQPCAWEQPRPSGSSSPLGSSCGTVQGSLHSATQAEEVAAMLRRASSGNLAGCGGGLPSAPQAATAGAAVPQAAASPINKRTKLRVKRDHMSNSRVAERSLTCNAYAQACQVDEAVRSDLLKANFTAALERLEGLSLAASPYLQFQLKLRRFVQLASLSAAAEGARGSPASYLASALALARSELAPMALHAYCEAFLDFKRGMSRLLVARGSDETSSDLQEFAGMVARAVRLETGSTASKLAQLLRYLLLLHQHQNHSHFHPCWWPSVTSQTQQLCARLLLPGRDAMPPEALEPRRCTSAVLRVREEDVQALRTSLGCDREEAVALLRRADGSAVAGLHDTLQATHIDHQLLAELAAEYASCRGLDAPPSPPPPRQQAAGEAMQVDELQPQQLQVAQQQQQQEEDREAQQQQQPHEERPPKVARWCLVEGGDVSAAAAARHQQLEAAAAADAEEQLELPAELSEQQLRHLLRQLEALLASQHSEQALARLEACDPAFLPAHPEAAFAMQRCRFLERLFAAPAAGGGSAAALLVARQHLSPLAQQHPELQPQLKAALAAALLPLPAPPGGSAEGSAAAQKQQQQAVADAVAAVRAALRPRCRLSEPRLLALIRELLGLHTAHFKLQHCQDRFASELGILALKASFPAAPAPTASAAAAAAAAAIAAEAQQALAAAAGGAGQPHWTGQVPVPGVRVLASESDDEEEMLAGGSEEDGSDDEAGVSEQAIITVCEFTGLSRHTAIDLLIAHGGDASAVLAHVFP